MGKEEDEEEEEEECKICRCGEEEDLPLIRPCLCKGSIASVHDECLTAWLKVKRQVRYTEGRESPGYVCVCVCVCACVCVCVTGRQPEGREPVLCISSQIEPLRL